MTVLDLTVAAPDGACPVSLHTPDGDGPWPAVIMYPDAVGTRPTFRAMADRMAGLGYATLLPDVYYRAGDWAPFDVNTVFADPDERARMMGLARSLTLDDVVGDARAFLDFLAERPEVAGERVGTTGYCMGGRISLTVAGHHPEGSWVGIGLAAVTLATMPPLAHAKRRVAEQLGSSATASESRQTMLCAYLSAALLVGLLANAALGWWWADPVTALVIAGVAVREGRDAWRGESCSCCA